MRYAIRWFKCKLKSPKNWLYFESGAGFNAIEARNIEKFYTNENPSIFTHHN